jgi:Immunoglobulin I-set domain.
VFQAEFVVHFHGIPTPKVVWYKDSFEIFSSRRMRVTFENDLSSLIIHQTAFTDEGEYKCTATNRAGHIITKAKLRLEGTAWLAGVLLVNCAAGEGANWS